MSIFPRDSTQLDPTRPGSEEEEEEPVLQAYSTNYAAAHPLNQSNSVIEASEVAVPGLKNDFDTGILTKSASGQREGYMVLGTFNENPRVIIVFVCLCLLVKDMRVFIFICLCLLLLLRRKKKEEKGRRMKRERSQTPGNR